MGRITRRVKAIRVNDERISARVDEVAVEEPLEIRVGDDALTVTMRTPGNDIELAHGFLLSEGVIHQAGDVQTARYCADTEELNTLQIFLAEGVAAVPLSAIRNLLAPGGCGLCGSTSIDAVLRSVPPVTDTRPAMSPAAVHRWIAELSSQQKVFARTGGVHGAALCRADGSVLVVREDVGRHNAVDKVIGWAVLEGIDRGDLGLMVSSRASFEIVQKAAMAGIGTLACVSAPSSLAIDAAREFGITLIGFVRDDRLSVFAGEDRCALADPAYDGSR